MRLIEDTLRDPPEHQRIPFALHRKAAHRNVVDAFFAGGQFVAPRDVVGGAGRPHFDLCMTSQMLGDIARVQFGASIDGEAVPLDDDRELHCSGVADGSADAGSADAADVRVVPGVALAEWVGSLVAVSAGWASAPNVFDLVEALIGDVWYRLLLDSGDYQVRAVIDLWIIRLKSGHETKAIQDSISIRG